jgi:hypothetical protein
MYLTPRKAPKDQGTSAQAGRGLTCISRGTPSMASSKEAQYPVRFNPAKNLTRQDQGMRMLATDTAVDEKAWGGARGRVHIRGALDAGAGLRSGLLNLHSRCAPRHETTCERGALPSCGVARKVHRTMCSRNRSPVRIRRRRGIGNRARRGGRRRGGAIGGSARCKRRTRG